MFIDISIDISIDIFIDISIDISIDILIDMCIYISIDILTDKVEGGGGGGEGGVDLSLKSNNPTPTGGELGKTTLRTFIFSFVIPHPSVWGC